jgi:hypothetical protein
MMHAAGMKILRSMRRYRRKKYASRPHFWTNSELEVDKIGLIHFHQPKSGGLVRSFGGTRYVRGWYIREKRSLIRMKRRISIEKMVIEVTSEAAKAPAVCPSDFVTAALVWLLPRRAEEFDMLVVDTCG